ncbi:ABC transporter permease [bacterium]|nr:ABC transporter permease [bacterium]
MIDARYVARVWRRNAVVWTKYWLGSFVGTVGEPLLYLFLLGYGMERLIKEVEGMSYSRFIAPGLILTASMYDATFECTYASFTRMTKQNTYRSIISTPVNLSEVVAGDILWATTRGVISAVLVSALLALLGLLDSPTLIFMPLLALLCGALFGSLAMVATGLARDYDFFTYFFTLVVSPMFLFSGIFFPLEGMSGWAVALAESLPMTWMVRMSRVLAYGRMDPAFFGDIVKSILSILVLFILSVRLIERRLIR